MRHLGISVTLTLVVATALCGARAHPLITSFYERRPLMAKLWPSLLDDRSSTVANEEDGRTTRRPEALTHVGESRDTNTTDSDHRHREVVEAIRQLLKKLEEDGRTKNSEKPNDVNIADIIKRLDDLSTSLNVSADFDPDQEVGEATNGTHNSDISLLFKKITYEFNDDADDHILHVCKGTRSHVFVPILLSACVMMLIMITLLKRTLRENN